MLYRDVPGETNHPQGPSEPTQVPAPNNAQTDVVSNITLWWTNIAIENGHRNSGYFSIKNGGSFHCYVSSPEGNHSFSI